VTDSTQEGTQFCKGFGGIGALLRYRNPVAAAVSTGIAPDIASFDTSSDEDFI
jgi:hypothetical protein